MNMKGAGATFALVQPTSIVPNVNNKSAKMSNGANALFLISAPSEPFAFSDKSIFVKVS
jgi:hypothetical protein